MAEQHTITLAAFQQAPQAPQDNSDSIVMNDATLMAQADMTPTQTTSATARNIIATLTALFSTSWSQYLDQHNQSQLRIRLAKFCVESLDAPATDATQTDTKAKPNVEPSVVRDVIHDEVVKQNKHLAATITKLQTCLDSIAKNSNRSRSLTSSNQQNNQLGESDDIIHNSPLALPRSSKPW
jgi:hypothetical protein